jgi:hypothetical protein
LDEEQRKWLKQYNSSLGVREFLRVGCATTVWILAGLALSLLVDSSNLFTVFFLAMFAFAVVAPKWKVTYSVLRKILGNESLPVEPFPRPVNKPTLQARPWWSYLPSVWWLILDLILFLLAWRVLSIK